MAAFSSSPLVESFTIGQLHSPSLSPSVSPAPSPTKTEVDFPADVDQSFNSSMTFAAADSPPPPSPEDLSGPKYSKAMLPPPPPFALAPPRRPLSTGSTALKSTASASDVLSTRPFGATRTFGRELSLNARPLATAGIKGKNAMTSSKQEISPVRLQWTMSNEDVSSPRVPMPRMGRREVRNAETSGC